MQHQPFLPPTYSSDIVLNTLVGFVVSLLHGLLFQVSKRPPTVSKHFKGSLADLMQKIMSASPHFVRCIKPNHKQLPNCFDKEIVETQLRYTGVSETIRIRRDGYPVRLDFAEFISRCVRVLSFSLLYSSYHQIVIIKNLSVYFSLVPT